MIDKHKLKKLAKIMVEYSIEVKEGYNVLLKGYGFDSYPLIKELYRECLKAGAASVHTRFSHAELGRIFLEEANDKQLTHVTDLDLDVAKNYDAMIQIVAEGNPYEMAGVDIKKRQKSQKAFKPLSDILHEKKWCLFYYPNLASATLAKKTLDEWEEFVMDSCLLDWKAELKMQEKFVKLMSNVKKVRITGDETDVTVHIAGQNWQTCCGKCNLPDGEIFTSPIRNKIDGVIKYNVPTNYQSKDFEWVKLTFKDGKVVDESSSDTKSLTEILDSDEGSRYVGEFAFGLNNAIVEGTRQILFDEKMGKSLHMALGKCYDECPNGNDSSIHWDLIFNFLWADAQIYFDDELVYKTGRWIDEKFEFLN